MSDVTVPATGPTDGLSDRPATGRIVVGVDGSASSKNALAWAASQAALTGDSLDVISTWSYPIYYGSVGWPADFNLEDAAHEELAKAVDEVVGQDNPLEVATRVRQGHPALVLVGAAKGAELLVVGCRGHGQFSGMLLGSVSQYCLAHAECPVVVVHDHRKSSQKD